MKIFSRSIVSISSILLLTFFSCSNPEVKQIDVLIIGGGASGVAAGTQSARFGSNTIIVEETFWLGGMLTASGVSAIDGNYKLPSGFWGEFRDSLVLYYGSLDSLKTGWVSNVQFEPSVGNQIFQNITAKEKNLQVYLNSKLLSVEKAKDGWLAYIQREDVVETINAKVLIDGTELGDVARMAGVEYQVGMDSRHDTGESIAPEKANHIVQDLTYVAILKDYKENVMIARPLGYDSTVFACAAINDLCVTPKEPERMWQRDIMITYGKLPNNKYMINWPIEGNDYYLNLIELNDDQRREELKKAKNFTLCFLYFIQKELGFETLGLADDEFPTLDLLPFMPYHRESRRINGEVRFNLNHITDPYTQKEKLYRTAVAVGDYPVDHHHARYEGYAELPNLFFHAVPSYGLPLGTLIPQNVDNLIVAEKSISVTNIVNGTTRLQPVVLQIGQVAGVLANLAIQKGMEVRDVSVRDVQRGILENGGYLLPYLDVEKSDPNFKTYQRIGSTGILQGQGKNVEWANETWLRINDLLLPSELIGLIDIFPSTTLPKSMKPMTHAEVRELVQKISEHENIELKVSIGAFVNKQNENTAITRGQFAILIDQVLDPFNAKDVNLKGEFKNNRP